MRAPETLLTPAQLAGWLGVDRGYVYAHAVELGAIRLPSKPNPKLAADADDARSVCSEGDPVRFSRCHYLAYISRTSKVSMCG